MQFRWLPEQSLAHTARTVSGCSELLLVVEHTKFKEFGICK